MRSIVIAGILMLFIPLWWITVQLSYKQGYDAAYCRYSEELYRKVGERLH